MVARRHGYNDAMRGGSKASARAACVVLAAGLVAGCGTGAPASTSSWQSAADRALGQAISGLGTARVALRLEADDRAPHDYTVVTVTDAIDTSGKEVSSFQVAQPPDGLHKANQVVGQALDDAVSLLVDVRIALASPGIDAAGAKKLIDRLDALRKKLDDLDSKVQSSPRSVETQ
jgi:hypothetical protein